MVMEKHERILYRKLITLIAINLKIKKVEMCTVLIQ